MHETNEHPSNLVEYQKKRTASAKRIFFYMFFFGIRVLMSSLMWNYFMQNYQDLLMRFSMNPIQRVNKSF